MPYCRMTANGWYRWCHTEWRIPVGFMRLYMVNGENLRGKVW